MVTCRICGKKFKQITTSGHLKKHKITREEYLDRFPDASTVCRSTILAHSKAISKRVKDGNHFVPFRDVPGLARKVHDKYMEGPIEYKCIQCGKIKATNKYWAIRRKFCSNQCHANHISENPDQYSERNSKISSSNLGRPKRPAKCNPYSRCKGGFREDIGHYIRSGWEADICRIFLHHGCQYDYEAYTIILDDNGKKISWTIDFVDPECLISEAGLVEVKGWWDEKSKRKVELMKQQRPETFEKITFIEFEQMKELIRKYSDVVVNWESIK